MKMVSQDYNEECLRNERKTPVLNSASTTEDWSCCFQCGIDYYFDYNQDVEQNGKQDL